MPRIRRLIIIQFRILNRHSIMGGPRSLTTWGPSSSPHPVFVRRIQMGLSLSLFRGREASLARLRIFDFLFIVSSEDSMRAWQGWRLSSGFRVQRVFVGGTPRWMTNLGRFLFGRIVVIVWVDFFVLILLFYWVFLFLVGWNLEIFCFYKNIIIIIHSNYFQ